MSALQEFLSTTSCHALSHFLNAVSKAAKITWVIISLIAFGFLVQQTSKLIAHYTDPYYKWTTSMYEETGSDFKYPTLTVCNFNRLMRSKMEALGAPEEAISAFFTMMFPVQYQFHKSVGFEEMERGISWAKKHNVTLPNLLNDLSQPCERMLVLVDQNYGGSDVCNQLKDFSVTASPINTPEMGRCYQINRMTRELPKYPDRVEFGQWLTVSPGTHTWISIQRVIKRMKTIDVFAFSPPCVKNPKLQIYRDKDYSLGLCKNDCWKAQEAKLCNCTVMTLSDDQEYKLCPDFNRTQECGAMLLQPEKKELVEKNALKCEETCLEPCDLVTVEATVTSTSFPNPAQIPKIRALLKNAGIELKKGENIRDRFASVTVYYKTFTDKIIERHETTTFEALLSNIGGQLGLWVGASVLTLAHGCMFAVENALKKRKQNNVESNT